MIRRVWMISALFVVSLTAGAAELSFKPVPACGRELQVQREAASLHLQASRLQAQGDLNGAREKWQSSLEAYRRIGFLEGQAEVLLQLGASYQVEGSLDPQKMTLSRNYAMQGYLAGAEFLDRLASHEVPNDPERVKGADSRFKQASDLSRTGDCQKAVPLFVEAGQQYAQAGFVAGELHTFVGRLRCQVKNGDPIGDMKILGEFLSAGPKFKFRAGTSERYLMAVGDDVRENREEAEKLYRTAMREFEEVKDLGNAARVALDLGGFLVRTEKLTEAETLFKRASEGFLGLSDAESQCNEAAALQNLGGVQLATGHTEAAIPALQRASELWQSLAEMARAAETLNALSGALRLQGNVTAAEDALALAKELEKKTEPKPASANDRQPGATLEGPSPDRPAIQPPLAQSPSPSAPSEGVLFVHSPRALAQREGTLLLREGDRLLQTGRLREAREKWLESATAFGKAPDYLGSAQAYKRLSDSYAPEVYSDPQKQLLSAKYLSLAMMALAKNRQENLKGRTSPLDETRLEEAGTLLEEAEKWIEAGDCAKAQPKLAEAKSLYQIMSLTVGEVSVLAFEGRCAAMAGDLYKATMTSVKAMEIISALPATAPTRELAWKAEGLFDQGRRDEALALFQAVLGQYEQAKDDKGVFDALLGLGVVQASKDDFAGAEESFSRALKSLPTLGLTDQDRRFQEAAARQNLGSVYALTGRGDKAVAELRAAVALWREVGGLVREVTALSVLGTALQASGDVPAALAALDEADSLQEQLPSNPEIEGDLLNNRAKVCYSQGRYQEALDLFQRALVLYRKLPDSQKEAQALTNLGAVEGDLGHYSEALAAHEQAKNIADRLGLATLSAKIWLNTAKLKIESGHYQEGIQICLGLLAKGIKDPQLLAMVHTNLSTAYLQLGAYDKAGPSLKQAIEVFQSIGSREFEATARVDYGQLLFRLGDHANAESETREALKIWRDLGNEAVVNRVLGNLGWQALSGKLSEEKFQVFKNGLESSRKAGLTVDSLRFSLLIGAVFLQRRDLAGTIEHASQALIEADRIGDSVGQYVGRTMLMEAHYYQGDFPTALKDLDAAVAGLDRWQSSLTLSEFKSSFMAQPVFFEAYALGVLLNAETGKPEEAFQYAEQARARAFRDQVGNQRIEVRRGADPELIRQEGELRAQLSHLDEAIQKEKTSTPASAVKSERQASLEKALEEAQSEYSTLLSRLKLANPEYASLVSVNILSLREIQQQVLDAQTTLIEYFVPDPPERGGSTPIFAWVIDRGHFTMIRLPISSSDLENQVKRIRFLIEGKDSVEPLAADLYRALFAPLALHVRHRNVVIVPHGVLHFLPFAALWDETNRHYLGDAYTLSYAPSATVLKFAREKKGRAVGPIVVAGNPDGSLPHAKTEAEAVAQFYGGEPLLGRAATKNAVVAQAERAGILHLAAHAELNPVNPLFTRVKLAPDGEPGSDLDMHEVFGLDLSRTGLVVLSACSTQMGKLSAGDELEGLTRAFIYAGTPAVIASLWDVNDDSTSFFMQRFYTHLRKEVGRAEALRLAQRETRKRFPHPYRWAAFVLTGDGR